MFEVAPLSRTLDPHPKYLDLSPTPQDLDHNLSVRKSLVEKGALFSVGKGL
jgi:hypothetical protein